LAEQFIFVLMICFLNPLKLVLLLASLARLQVQDIQP
jgi:hypothetical protein